MWQKNLQQLDLKDNNWAWLAVDGSLTKFLQQQAYPEDLTIKLLQQNWRMPTKEQQLHLQLFDNSEILERHIVMTVMNRPWLFARTSFTRAASNYMGDKLSNLSSNSLGELIAKSFPGLYREHFEFAYLDSSSSLLREIIETLKNNKLELDLVNNIIRNKLIIRRSLFYRNNNHDKLALFNIDEVFLPALVNKMLNLEVEV